MKKRGWLYIVVSALLLFTLAACNGSNSAGESGHASAKILADFNLNAKNKVSFATTIVDLIANIASMTLDVSNGTNTIVQDMPLTKNGGTWSVTINDLPVGAQLTFTGHAYDSSSKEIFTGTTYQTLSGSNNQVLLNMSPVMDGTTSQLPMITRIGLPSSIAALTAAPVSISMAGSSGETLSYEITPAANGGAFSSLTGTISLNGTFATVVLDYTAPDTPGAYTHTVKVTNSIGNSVETTFDTNVVQQLTGAEVIVQFSPLVTAIGAHRSGTDVTFAASVSDLGSITNLTYNWSFDNGLSFADPSTNPAVMQGYDESITGNIILTVTNGAGASTTVTYVINQRQFPNSVVSNIVLFPQNPFTPDLDDCRFGAVSGNIATLVADESEVQQDLNNDGDTDDRVLEYVDVNTRTIVNTGVAVSQDSIAISGDIIAFQYPGEWTGTGYSGTIGWYSISANAAYDTGMVPLVFGREYWGPTRVVSAGRIAYLAATRDLNGDGSADVELNIYDTNTLQNTQTGVLVGPGPDIYYWNWRDYVPSFYGNLVALVGPTGTIEYYDVATQQTTDTGITGSHPTIDNGIILFNDPTGYHAYYQISTGKYVITPLPVHHNHDASISNGIIAGAIREDSYWGDLNGSGVIGDDEDGTIVLYDIPTGRMVSTGVPLCCGPEISGYVIAYDYAVCDQWYMVIDDLVKRYFGR